MSDTVATELQAEPFDVPLQNGAKAPSSQAGSPLFAELVWAHYRYQRRRDSRRRADEDMAVLEQAYLDKLKEFQETTGELEHVYWSTKNASAVGMTVKREAKPKRNLFGRLLRTLDEHDEPVALHRLSDWVTSDAPRVADLLHECDLLAIRAGEVLRGTPERIALRWLLGVQAHLLGFVERAERLPDKAAEKELVRVQKAQLAAIERYYHRAASKAGRLVYVSGMLIGLIPVGVVALALGLGLWATGLWGENAELIVLSIGAGTVGALVSAISRMGKPERGKFNVDFELGRPLIRRLGFFRPLLGAVVGVALFFLLASGIAQVAVQDGKELYYYGFVAFLAGFSERFVNVMFGAAERRLGPKAAGGDDDDEDEPT
jgi:hypothetical protein